MANEPNPFAVLMERVIQGDEQAFVEVCDRYGKAIMRIIRYRLDQTPWLRSQFDSLDFFQDVSKEVIAYREKLREFTTPQAFIKHVVEIASHKVQKAQRKHATQKRDRRRVRHLSEPTAATAAAAVADSQPNPAERSASLDAWQNWVQPLPQRQRAIVQMLLDGRTHQEIAEELRCSVRSIERMVAKLRITPPPEL